MYSTIGVTGRTRSGATCTVLTASATLVTTFRPTQSPDARDAAIACAPRSSTSCTLPGNSTGIPNDASVDSVADGRVEDLHEGSSPHKATSPPFGCAPEKLPW